jgi:hypothetical protein
MEIVMLRVAAQRDLGIAYEVALSRSDQKAFMTGERILELRLLSYQ